MVYLGYCFFGFKRVLAGTAMLAGIVVIAMLPTAAALAALFAAFVALVVATTYYQRQANLLRVLVAGGESLGTERVREAA